MGPAAFGDPAQDRPLLLVRDRLVGARGRGYARNKIATPAMATRVPATARGRIGSLKRFKDDVREVAAGFECGIGVEGFNDIHVGDVIEAYVKEQVERKL